MNIFTDVSSNKRKAIPSFLVFPNFDSNPGEYNKFLRIVSDGKRPTDTILGIVICLET